MVKIRNAADEDWNDVWPIVQDASVNQLAGISHNYL